jgi:hypothetical protein
LRQEKLEELKNTPETSGEDHQEKRAEAAREIINKQEVAPEPAPAAETQSKPAFSIPFLNHKLNYAQTLASVQRKLSPVSRSFSKVIHTPIVEKTSQALENTVARPSVTFGATWTALIVGAIFYFTARAYGYALSGSEMIFSFVVGAILGLVLEGLWRTLKRRRIR